MTSLGSSKARLKTRNQRFAAKAHGVYFFVNVLFDMKGPLWAHFLHTHHVFWNLTSTHKSTSFWASRISKQSSLSESHCCRACHPAPCKQQGHWQDPRPHSLPPHLSMKPNSNCRDVSSLYIIGDRAMRHDTMKCWHATLFQKEAFCHLWCWLWTVNKTCQKTIFFLYWTYSLCTNKKRHEQSFTFHELYLLFCTSFESSILLKTERKFCTNEHFTFYKISTRQWNWQMVHLPLNKLDICLFWKSNLPAKLRNAMNETMAQN